MRSGARMRSSKEIIGQVTQVCTALHSIYDSDLRRLRPQATCTVSYRTRINDPRVLMFLALR